MYIVWVWVELTSGINTTSYILSAAVFTKNGFCKHRSISVVKLQLGLCSSVANSDRRGPVVQVAEVIDVQMG